MKDEHFQKSDSAASSLAEETGHFHVKWEAKKGQL